MGRAMVDLYCTSFRQVPRRIVLDVDDTFDAVHGGQQMRLFNAHYDEYVIAVGNRVTPVPPHRSVRAGLPHTAPTLGV